jgi:hypothetical protein
MPDYEIHHVHPLSEDASYLTTEASTSTQTPEIRIQRDKSRSADLVGGASLGASAEGLDGPVTLPQPTVTAALTISATYLRALELSI